MTIWHILFPIFAVTPVAVNYAAMRVDPKHGDAFGLAMMILAIFIATTAIGVLLPKPDRQGFNALFDFYAGLTCLSYWIRHRQGWVLLLTGLFALQCVLAAAFWLGWEVFNQALQYGDYLRSNNVVWVLELACLTGVGGWSVVRRYFDLLRSRSDHRHHTGAAA